MPLLHFGLKKMRKTHKLRDMENSMRGSNTHLIGVSEETRREQLYYLERLLIKTHNPKIEKIKPKEES